MLRHHIPSIIISGDLSWTSPSNKLPVKMESLHICLESKASETQESRILRRVPVDISTFDKIDSKQLNKNLACLVDPALLTTPAIIPRAAPLVRGETLNSTSGDVEKSLAKSATVGQVSSHGYK